MLHREGRRIEYRHVVAIANRLNRLRKGKQIFPIEPIRDLTNPLVVVADVFRNRINMAAIYAIVKGAFELF